MSQSNAFKSSPSSSSSSSSSSSTKGAADQRMINQDSSLDQHRRTHSQAHFFYTREALLQLRPAASRLNDAQHPFGGNNHSSIPAGLIVRHV